MSRRFTSTPVHEGVSHDQDKKWDPGSPSRSTSTTSPETPTTINDDNQASVNTVGVKVSRARLDPPRRIRSLRERVGDVLGKFHHQSNLPDKTTEDEKEANSAAIRNALIQDTEQLITEFEADTLSPVPFSWLGMKINDSERKKEERYRQKYVAQLLLARAFLLEGDLTLCHRLLACRIPFPEGEFGSSSPLYVDKDATRPSISEAECRVRGCLFCGGDTREAEANVKRIIERYEHVRLSDFVSLTLVLGNHPETVLVDDVYRAVVAAMNKVAQNDVWKDHRAFLGTVRDIELFDDNHQPWGHIHVIGLWATDDAEERRAYLGSIEATWVSATQGLGRLESRPLRNLKRNLTYNGKGYAPHTKPPPHLGVGLDQMRAVARLSIKQVGYHFTTGCFTPSALGLTVRKRSNRPRQARKKTGTGSPPQQKTLGPLRVRQNRQEVHTPQAARDRARRQARPSLGRVRYRADGSVVNVHNIVLRDGDGAVAGIGDSLAASGFNGQAWDSKASPEEEREAILGELERGSGSVAVGALAGVGKSSLLLDVVRQRPRLPTLVLSFTRNAVARLEPELPKRGRVQAATLHSVGLSAWRDHVRGDVRRDPQKVERIVEHMVGAAHTGIGAEVVAFVRRAKALGLDPRDLGALEMVNGRVASLVREALALSLKDHRCIDDDDMIYMPVVHGVRLPRPEFTCIDECQDLTPAQVTLVTRLVGDRRAFVVGDRWQSISLFRGAAADALTSLVEQLGIPELPLSFSHRCPERVAAEARVYCPQFRSAPGNATGEVLTVKRYLDHLYDWCAPGVLVLARAKSEFTALRRVLHKTEFNVNVMFADAEHGSVAASPGQTTLNPDSVNLATIHAAKGLEAEDVCFINTPVFDAGALTTDEEQQEINARYVAITRSSRRFTYLVGGRPEQG